jgi:signal transduction histidine kinase
VCQQLSGLAFMVEGLAHSVEKKGLAKEAADAEELARLVRETTEQARDVARGLHPVDVDANGLVVALRDMAARFTARGPARCTLQCPAPTPVRDNEAAMHLFRIAQEAVVNAIKHAHASRIVIRIGTQGGCLVLSVTDNGRGLPDNCEASSGLGLRLMRHRAQVIGGDFTVKRRPRGGTVVKCRLPARLSHG